VTKEPSPCHTMSHVILVSARVILTLPPCHPDESQDRFREDSESGGMLQ